MTGLTKPCPDCDGDGRYCTACRNHGWEVEFRNLAGRLLTRWPCPKCTYAKDERPTCHPCDGSGRVPVMESELEAAGQLNALTEE